MLQSTKQYKSGAKITCYTQVGIRREIRAAFQQHARTRTHTHTCKTFTSRSILLEEEEEEGGEKMREGGKLILTCSPLGTYCMHIKYT